MKKVFLVLAVTAGLFLTSCELDKDDSSTYEIEQDATDKGDTSTAGDKGEN